MAIKGRSTGGGFKGKKMPNVAARKTRGQAAIGPIKPRGARATSASNGGAGTGAPYKNVTSATKKLR